MKSDRNKMLINNELINITRRIFYYGCDSAKDFEIKYGIKPAAFSRYKNFLLDVLGEYIEEVMLPNSKTTVLRFKTDEFETPFNILLELYTLKKISEQDFLFFLETMIFFTGENENKSFQLKDLYEAIHIPSKSGGVSISEQTFQRNLKELSEYGYLTRSGKSIFRYTKPESLLASLDAETLYHFTAFTDLCRNFCYPAVCGHYLLDTVALINQQKQVTYEELFRCKHLHMGQVLDDSKLWQLIIAIHDKKIISFKNKKAKMEHYQPYKIIINEKDGRRYLFCIPLENSEDNRFLYRLDKIFDIKEEKKNSCQPLTSEQCEKLYLQTLGKSFTGTTAFQGKLQTGVLIYQTTFYNEVHKYFPDAVPEHVDSSHDKIKIEVNSLRELKPWLRQNLGKVRITDTSDSTAQDMEDELTRWRKKYGIT